MMNKTETKKILREYSEDVRINYRYILDSLRAFSYNVRQ